MWPLKHLPSRSMGEDKSQLLYVQIDTSQRPLGYHDGDGDSTSNMLSSYLYPMTEVLKSTLFYKWGNRGIGHSNEPARVIQMVYGAARIGTQAVRFHSSCSSLSQNKMFSLTCPWSSSLGDTGTR